ncbi:MAG: DNA (cytosine-5-)-methyltransferase [Gammaproteobacteria bacterium]|nr:DNA (cytosine-5-)-methyltransferase [Gammaproteobacteria bacterium]MBY0544814.1 DNA (cytosine-5-)-methyltransferase [Gammaproteobacteria bacterium]
MNKTILQKPTVIELFAGGGGMALGFERAGFQHVLLNDNNRRCCETLQRNRPHWPVWKRDIKTIDFTSFYRQVDVVTGGFPCQAFSNAGKRRGFEDERGMLIFEFLRAIFEIQPKIFIAENVKGLFNDKTLDTINDVYRILTERGYNVLSPEVLQAANYRVPQLRERVIIVGVRSDIAANFEFEKPNDTIFTLHDALKAGKLYSTDVPESEGSQYSDKKCQILSQVPAGGNWKDLSLDALKAYLGDWHEHVHGSQIARRLSWDKPSYTLMTTPSSRLIDRCHPDETRPLTVREYARLQTFPDDWQFAGGLTAQYRQIGNAVPVNLAESLAQAALKTLQQHSQ